MIKRLKTAWGRHPILTVGFLLALALTTLFTFRNITGLVYWSDPDHQNQPVEGWMTPRYIMHSWNLTPEDVMAIVGHGPLPPRRHTLEEIARDRGVPLETLINNLTQALTARKSDQK